MSAIVKIQEILGVTPDGIWGPRTQAALDSLIQGYSGDSGWHSTTATSFADPADVAAFKRCKAQGKSDHECFAVGDNGIGSWGDPTVCRIGAVLRVAGISVETVRKFGAREACNRSGQR